QIRPGDRLEAVEGRSVVTLPHRELAQILRRAGNTLRLTIVPRSSTCRHSHKHPNIHICHSAKLGSYFTIRLSFADSANLPETRDSRYYSVDLDRGPSGFGFSLRGGSEYNMGLYVLGLMEGGPASRSQKMQLVEINGNSTAGMTHSQAVEQIRRGGHRIHLVLKRGNGYVPDYGKAAWEHFNFKRLNRYEKEDNVEQSSSVKRPLRSVGVIDPESQRKPFSFLASTLSIDQLGDDESDSEGSHSDGSVSAASISTLSLVTTQPGPWFMPSQQRLTQVMKENRQADRAWGKKKK
uniref:PDZ domain-containing protein n=1 Tax=Neolamprologus brichardi TaxID=32507 RepID=A0A3Q4H560_NEOBR